MDLSKANFLNGGDKLSEYGEEVRECAEVIKKALIKHGFLSAGLNDAVWLWSEYSDSLAAGWIGGSHPEDVEYFKCEDDFLDEVFACVKPYIRKYVYPAE